MIDKTEHAVDITALVCTFNRVADLRELLESALAQETKGLFTYEILVIDNNSSDDTRAVAEDFVARGHNKIRYLFEGRQGKSYALNKGLSAARGIVYAIADDDLILPENYLSSIWEAFRAHPEVSIVGGKVLPLWKGEAPSWLTSEHWSAIAMCDYGEEKIYTDERRQLCLLAASYSLADVKAVGGYHRELSVSKGKIGGTEDADLMSRLYAAGRKGLYLPNLVLYHKVEPERLSKDYHRRWHMGHGSSYAVMRNETVEKASARFLDVPAHMYRQAAKDALGWLKHSLRNRRDEAFSHETQLRFFQGFFRKRREDFSASGGRGVGREAVSFVRSLIKEKFMARRRKSTVESTRGRS